MKIGRNSNSVSVLTHTFTKLDPTFQPCMETPSLHMCFSVAYAHMCACGHINYNVKTKYVLRIKLEIGSADVLKSLIHVDWATAGEGGHEDLVPVNTTSVLFPL
jgi:hypothetical protein